jgi:bifunctional enzyme CysN/CysC/sulfate adenylyltransferase subunit 1
VTVELEDEIDLSRGEMLVAASAETALPEVSRRLNAMVVWMHEEPLVVGRTYLAKHTTRTVRATVKAIRYRVDVGSLDHAPAEQLSMNDIAEVELETNLPLFFDAYAESRMTGSLILIDGVTNATVGAAMIVSAAEAQDDAQERATLILVPGRPELAERVRQTLELHLQRVVIVDDELIPDEALVAAVRALWLAGVTAVTARSLTVERLAEIVRVVESFGEGRVVVGEGFDDGEILRLWGVKE